MVQTWEVCHRSGHRLSQSFPQSVPILHSPLVVMTSLFPPSSPSHTPQLLHYRRVLNQKRKLHLRRRPGHSRATNRTILLPQRRLLSPGSIHNRERTRCRERQKDSLRILHHKTRPPNTILIRHKTTTEPMIQCDRVSQFKPKADHTYLQRTHYLAAHLEALHR